jgi:hypothetical protein
MSNKKELLDLIEEGNDYLRELGDKITAWENIINNPEFTEDKEEARAELAEMKVLFDKMGLMKIEIQTQLGKS